MYNLANKRISLTGANSMLGKEVHIKLMDRGSLVDPILHKECNLLDWRETLDRFCQFKPDFVLHLAGFNGNISFNQRFPAKIYSQTVLMGLNVLEASFLTSAKKVVSVISSCAYPDIQHDENGLYEEQFFQGLPNITVESHGLAKRTLLEYGRQLYKQYGTIATSCVLNNCYGPQDSTDLNKTKVVMSLIKKFVDARDNKDNEVVCWGTGSPRRELLFSRDAAEGIVRTLEYYDNVLLPLNIGPGNDISIKELAEKVAAIVGYNGIIRWDTTKLDGQMRKLLNNTRMKSYLSFTPNTLLDDGLKETIEWYEKNRLSV
jgi:GDP-L-fucose synthase